MSCIFHVICLYYLVKHLTCMNKCIRISQQPQLRAGIPTLSTRMDYSLVWLHLMEFVDDEIELTNTYFTIFTNFNLDRFLPVSSKGYWINEKWLHLKPNTTVGIFSDSLLILSAIQLQILVLQVSNRVKCVR